MPDFTVIDGDGPPKEQRAAERKVRVASCELAANILRIVRGAGKPETIVDQMKAVLDAGFDYQDIAGYWPIDTIAEALKVKDNLEDVTEMAERGEADKSRISRMRESIMFAERDIRLGALQAVASRLVGQDLQEAAGDRQMRDGVDKIERIREERRKADRAAARQARAAASPTKKRRSRKAPAKTKDPR
jgi:hypothetical protein